MLKLNGIEKKFGDFAIHSLSLKVEHGDYFVLLGQSGSGKSVILQIITGLIQQDSGDVIIDGKNCNTEKIQNRHAGYLFQDYALFPHLSVKQNIAYPLKNQKISFTEAELKIKQIAYSFELDHLLNKMPETLSGGEKQRVALARSLIVQPKILLLDEPLSALDTQLKASIRNLLRTINKKGQTIIHITHDHGEAISLANKVAVIHDGNLLQSGTLHEVFQHPRSLYVASFLGIKNFFKCTLLLHHGEKQVKLENGISFTVECEESEAEGFVIIDADSIILSDTESESSARNCFYGCISEIIPYKNGFEVFVDIGIKICCLITKLSLSKLSLAESKNVFVSFKANSAKFIKL
jgi:ABC-type Fe3+/spermidine/putrescine transport system ATPase subunit